MRGTRRDVEQGRHVAAGLLDGDTTPVAAGLARSGPDAWIAFDKEVRRVHSRSYGPLSTGRIEARLCDPDGRIRAAALAAWRNPPLQLVLIRCADWVPAVRDRARRVLGRAVAKDPVGALIALAPLVLRLGRREHGAWGLEQLEAALSGRYSLLAAWWRPGQPSTTWSWNALTGGQRAFILSRLSEGADLPARRFAARVTLAAGRVDVRESARRAAAERDPLTSRIWTDGALAAMAADGPDDAAVDALLGAHLPMARAAGVTALRRAGRAREAADHLADRSGMVRACARWLMRQDGADPCAHYRALVEDPARVTGYAVTGFVECGGLGGSEDAAALHALLSHPAGAVRAAAVAGLSERGGCGQTLLLAMLDDPSASVAREVSRSLLDSAGRLPTAWLAECAAADRPLHTRRAAFRLLRAQGGIGALRAAVDLLTVPDPALRALAADTVWDSPDPHRLARHFARLGLAG
ncbi:hypothetical protein [Streptomyces sp. NPDC023588]|uniref:hypothetical protein n=1 Tax=Streptomyces sp. NPDC023588 TaxID=3154907 RepID=UPI0033F04EFA